MVTNTNVAERATKIIADNLGLDESEITPDARFREDLGVDSLDVIDTIMQLEKNFAVSIPDEIAERVKRVGDLFQYIEKKTGTLTPVNAI